MHSSSHFVQIYDDPKYVADAVLEYIGAGLAAGEGAIVIARPALRARFSASPQLRLLDAEETLARFMVNGSPCWQLFREAVGGLIAEMRLQYPTVRAYGEMVDILWQAGSREAAIRLEEYWNELRKLQTFSLFCAYRLHPLEVEESICRAHTHVLPLREWPDFDADVQRAAEKVLDQPLAELLLSLAASHRSPGALGAGHAALFWLHQNMPRAAEKMLSELRSRSLPAG